MDVAHDFAGKPAAAWELYLQQENTQQSLQLLHLIANECYQAGFFFPAARAFDVLEQLHPAALYGQAKQGACVGTLQMVIAGKESPDSLRYVLSVGVTRCSNALCRSVLSPAIADASMCRG